MTTEIDTIKRTTDLLALVGNTHLRKVGANWYAGPCPFCGGTDRFTLKKTADGWQLTMPPCTARAIITSRLGWPTLPA
jgi:hypothetical protein